MVATRMVPSRPALVVEEEKRHLVVADLHIGFESRLAANNVFIGGNSTVKEAISEISEMISGERVESLILLGDVKAGIKTISKAEWHDVPLFFEEVKKLAGITLVPGNHDANIERLIPGDITLASSSGLVLGNALLTHGHTMPSENFSHVEKIIIGHVHPVFLDEDSVLNGQRVWVSARAQKDDLFPSARGRIELLMMPSFNRYLYAAHRRGRKKSISPIMQRIKRLESARVVTLDGSIIGDGSILDRVIGPPTGAPQGEVRS